MTVSSEERSAGHEPDLDRPVRLHPLVYLAEGDEVTVGRPDIDSYGIFPPDGAEFVRRLEQGDTPREAAAWYQRTYGESVDAADLLGALAELELLRDSEEPAPVQQPVRWQGLGKAAFSPVAWSGYALLVAWAGWAMVRSPELVPHYRSIFFTEYYSVIELVLFFGQFPLILVHESFHALAGRRLGLRSRLSVGRRLYFVVLETSLDGLVAVPRRKRYLPILAGMLADVLVLAALTLAADLTRGPDGALSLPGRICLALAFATVLRLAWQCYVYLRTDLYVLFTTVLGCVDLHSTARRTLRNRFNRLLGRHDRLLDESTWHPADRRAARWYSWLMVAGYTLTIVMLVIAVVPTAVRFLSGVFSRFVVDATGVELLDTGVFLAINVAQIAIVAVLSVRRRRQRKREPELRHLVS